MRPSLFFLTVLLSVFYGEPYTFDTRYIEVPLDHYSFSNTLTFKLRYLVNDTFYKENGPILFYTGNEGNIDMFAQNTGFMFDIAPQLNASIIFAEHRYYGESLPFGNLSYSSLDHLGYLSTSQALADFSYLISVLKLSYPTTNGKTLPVIAFGGSYGGMLSAYLRMKFPFSVIGAVASSAPIYMYPYLTECDSFSKTATRTFSTIGGEKCSRAISKSWKIIRNFTSTQEGRLQLSSMWRFCDVLTTTNQTDVVVDWLKEIYEFLAEMNYPYSTNFLMPLPANPVKEFCDHIRQEEYTDDVELLQDLGEALQVYVNYTGSAKCINFNQTATDNLGETGWFFQTCTDMIQYLCSTDDDMFENYEFDYEAYRANCREKFFGIEPRSPYVPLWEYGGTYLSSYSNILFVNGKLDPWSGLGVLQNVSTTVWAIVIPSGAHHLDLRASNPNDTMDVIGARAMVLNQIYNWLFEYRSNYTVESEEVVVTLVK